MPFNEQQGKARRLRQLVLNFRPGGRGVFAMFLSTQGNGGLFNHQALGRRKSVV
jgi:hypothetical protein